MLRFSLRSCWLAALCALVLAGCVPGVNQPYPTFTPDRTLEAIPRMLTATSAAPTITPTVLRSPTPTRTLTPTPPQPGSPSLPGAQGERIPAGGAALTVLSATAPETIGTLRRVEGTRYQNLEVIIENASEDTVEYNRLFFTLVGEEAQYESLAQAAGPVLLSGTLRPGEWVRGHVAFAIPEEAEPLRLRYDPGVPDGQIWVRLEAEGDTNPAADAPVPATGPLNGLPGPGERVEASGLALTVEQVNAAARIPPARAEKGYIFVDLLVTIANDGHDSAPFNAGYFRVKDALGYEYTATSVPLETLIHAGSLGRNQRVQGHVIFQVPEDTQALRLQYQPQVLAETYEPIQVAIEVPAAK